MNEKINTGGPAFPSGDSEVKHTQENGYSVKRELHALHEGMTLRDYFMAHAPAEPQPWFVPVTPPAPDLSIWVGESGRKYDGERAAMGSEEGLRGKVRPVNADAYYAWRNEQGKQRYVQWPAAWADEMLKARASVAKAAGDPQ